MREAFSAFGAPEAGKPAPRVSRCHACGAPSAVASSRGPLPRYCPTCQLVIAAAWAIRKGIAPARAAGLADVAAELERIAARVELHAGAGRDRRDLAPTDDAELPIRALDEGPHGPTGHAEDDADLAIAAADADQPQDLALARREAADLSEHADKIPDSSTTPRCARNDGDLASRTAVHAVGERE